ncbi:MAG: hypothetical protein GQ582_13720 [Methyloprofundus sp.]|nr:hypothetical protein [Methyloprofundus sp.]
MNTLPEAVNKQFSELFASFYNATDDLKIAGAEANLIGDFSQVAEINALCQKLQNLDAEVKAVLNSFSANTPSRRSQSHQKSAARTRTPSSRLKVKISGEVVAEATIAQTFFKTLSILGFERVAKLNKMVSNAPLVSKTPTTGYQTQRRCDSWYITTHVGKRTATRVLAEIGKQLNVPIQFETY